MLALDEMAKPNGAFYAYDWKLELIIDILKNVPIKNMPNSFWNACKFIK